MEDAIKHIAWATSLVGCVYFATTHQWTPIQLNVSAPTSAERVVPVQSGAVRQAFADPKLVQNDDQRLIPALGGQHQASDGRNLTEDDLRKALAQQALANAGAGQGRPQTGAQAGVAALPGGAGAGAALPAQTQSAAFATIEDVASARTVSETLGKLEGIVDVPAGAKPGAVATIFFDPRCPYCHAAFKALHGKVAVRWVPVSVLGQPEVGEQMSAAILSAPDRVAALEAAFERKESVAAGSAAPAEITRKVAENRDAFASIFAASPALRPGVPTMFVPRPDGRLAIMVGYEPGDETKLISVMAGS